jgi:hypothetical protein
LAPRDAGDAGHVGGDVLGVLADDEVGRHEDRGVVGDALLDLARVGDLLLDDALDRVAVHPVGPRLGEGGIEIRSDVGAGSGLREGVAGAAFLQEQRPAAVEVGVLGGVAAGQEREPAEDDRERAQADASLPAERGSGHAPHPIWRRRDSGPLGAAIG